MRIAIVLLLAAALATPSPPAQRPLVSGIDLTSIDASVRPQDDLFRFVNGGWLARTEIPPDGVQANAFIELANKADADLRAIIEEVGSLAHRRGGSPPQQIADLYASMMDEARLEELGARAIQPVLDRIAAIDSASGMAAVAGYLSAIGAGGPFAGTVGFHPDERRGLVVQVARGGTLLPEVAQYLQSDAASAALRTEYAAYLRRVFTLVGRTDPAADAAAVMALETRLAAAQAETAADTVDSRRRFALAELAVQMPGFDWRAWAKPQRLDRLAGVMLTPPAFFGRFAALVPDVPLETWKAWLTARYVTAASTFLSRPFDEARFEFFGRVLTGQQQPRPRWKRGVSLVNGYLGDALGRLYVERHFQPTTRARVETIVINVREAFRRAIASADWMSTPTRRVALAKLATLSTKIGGPSQWRDYGGLDIRVDDLIGNVQRAQAFENEYRMNVIARRAGRGDWPITPQTVNATYRPAVNEIVLPAAILKPPLFDAAADEAINYGSLGAILGHEIGHAFDGQGRRYDARGPSRDWWTSADDQRFSLLIRPLVEQYDRFRPVAGLEGYGAHTMSENVGDLGGLAMAYEAYRIALDGRTPDVIDAFTGPQRFFIGWARAWRGKIRETFVRQWVLSTPHALPEGRVNGPTAHIAAFHEAFQTRPGDKLYRAPEKRVRIW